MEDCAGELCIPQNNGMDSGCASAHITTRSVTALDLDAIARWYRGWGMASVPLDYFPPIGCLARNDEHSIAAAFLYRTDAKVAYIENLISNPDSTKRERAEAIPMIHQELARQAKDYGYRYLVSWTANEALLSKVKKLGYVTTEANHFAIGIRL